MLNKGYLTSDRGIKGDEVYTPFYAVDPIVKYLPKDKIIWCGFDEKWSAFYQRLKENGYKVVRSSLCENQDFFNFEPKEWDIFVSNPPFSKKDEVLERLYTLGKPFAILLPLNALQSKKRFNFFKKKGIQLLCFDKRINYFMDGNFDKVSKGVAFASSYFCYNLLPRDLIFSSLDEYERGLFCESDV